MILVINVCREKLHYPEFVKPIEKILEKNEIGFFTKSFLDLTQKDFGKADKIIICGTSLKDNFYSEHPEKFEWINECNKPILGICAGMQIIGLVNKNKKLDKKKDIVFFKENFRKEFLGLNGENEVYHLHNFYFDFNLLKDFEIYNNREIAQAVKHKNKEIYGVLFHPEVRNKEMIVNFCGIY
jgi:anthranilate/para-aminobenzoate synthase component II